MTNAPQQPPGIPGGVPILGGQPPQLVLVSMSMPAPDGKGIVSAVTGVPLELMKAGPLGPPEQMQELAGQAQQNVLGTVQQLMAAYAQQLHQTNGAHQPVGGEG